MVILALVISVARENMKTEDSGSGSGVCGGGCSGGDSRGSSSNTKLYLL